MNKLITFYRKQKGNKRRKLAQLFLLFILVLGYTYFVTMWAPESYVSLVGAQKHVLVKYIVIIAFSVIVAIRLDMHIVRSSFNLRKQITELEMWNKFILHFAFLKTGSSDEKTQVLDTLKYLEDNELKDQLIEIYENNTSLKDAHQAIYDRYDYPQIKTFFAEAENSLVHGYDENELMKKSALYIDNYVTKLNVYCDAKEAGYKISRSLIAVVLILIPAIKVLFSSVTIDFTSSISGMVLSLVILYVIISLLINAKRQYTRPFIGFGGDDLE